MKNYFFKAIVILIAISSAFLINGKAGSAADKKDAIDSGREAPTTKSSKDRSQEDDSMFNALIEKARDVLRGTYDVIVSPLDASSALGQAAMSAKTWSKGLSDIVAKQNEIFSKSGDAVSKNVSEAYDASEELVIEAVTVSKETGDKIVEQVSLNVVVPVRWADALGLSTNEYASFVAEGKDPKMLVAVP
ncbi:hypothetical protein, partial [Kaarinaea lacus]